MRSILPPVALLISVASLHAAATATPAPATDTRADENAPDNFPLTLRGFFGKGDKAEVSVQNKNSGKSVWIKPGASHTGWKLESADATTGRAVFSQGERRVTLFQAGEVHPPAVSKIASSESAGIESEEPSDNPDYEADPYSSEAADKLDELLTKKPGCKELLDALREAANTSLGIKFEDLYDEKGNPRGGLIRARSEEMSRLLLQITTPEAELLKPVWAAYAEGFQAGLGSGPESEGMSDADSSDENRGDGNRTDIL